MPTPAKERECRNRKPTVKGCIWGQQDGQYDGLCELEYASQIARSTQKCVPMKKHLKCQQRFITRPPYCKADMNNCEAVRLEKRNYSVCLPHVDAGSDTDSVYSSDHQDQGNRRQNPQGVGSTRRNLLAVFASTGPGAAV